MKALREIVTIILILAIVVTTVGCSQEQADLNSAPYPFSQVNHRINYGKDVYYTNDFTIEGSVITLHGYWGRVALTRDYNPNDLVLSGSWSIAIIK